MNLSVYSVKYTPCMYLSRGFSISIAYGFVSSRAILALFAVDPRLHACLVRMNPI